MLKLEDHYDIVYLDLDNTLIYGPITDLMDITWKMFKCQLIATFLAFIQSKFRLYKVNHKLLYRVRRCGLPIVILTARKPLNSTKELVAQLEIPQCTLIEMSSQHPYIDKIETILDLANTDETRLVLFDDNELTRLNAISNDIVAVDPALEKNID